MDDLEKQIKCKIDNIDEYLDLCYKLIDTYYNADNRIALLVTTTIVIETGMIRAYKITGLTHTGAICSLYTNNICNKKYRKISSSIRSMRNDLVHLNVNSNSSKERLTSMLERSNSKYFKSYLTDLFGEINFEDNYKRKMYDILSRVLEIEPPKSDTTGIVDFSDVKRLDIV